MLKNEPRRKKRQKRLEKPQSCMQRNCDKNEQTRHDSRKPTSWLNRNGLRNYA